MDDPQGEYLIALDERVRRLEGEVEQLSEPLRAGATVVAAPINGREPDKSTVKMMITTPFAAETY
jgi:hypothetical protein